MGKCFVLLLAAAVTLGCDPLKSEEEDRAALQRLEQEARALANTTGCSTASECRTAPVGSKACGGPRTYLVYCAATTDSVALFRKLDELKRAEDDFNRRYGVVSTCDFVLPPAVTLSGGECQAAR